MKSPTLHGGLTRKMPSGDSGMRPGSGSVNNGTTRSKPAATPRSLGPRTA